MVSMKGSRHWAAAILAAWLPLTPLSAAHLDPAITQGHLMERLTSAQAPPLIDVRTPEEYRAGHIPGAINIPLQQFEKRLDELEAYRDEEVVLYCESGGRAAYGGRWLATRGFQELRLLDGHMGAWRTAGLPTER